MFEFLPLVGGALNILGGLTNDNDPTAMPTQQTGFAALPGQVQNAYLNTYLPGVMNQYQNKPFGMPMAQAPSGPFASQGLQQLQRYSNQVGGIFGGGTGVYPVGQVEPLHPFQQSALASLGAGLGNQQTVLGNAFAQPQPQQQQQAFQMPQQPQAFAAPSMGQATGEFNMPPQAPVAPAAQAQPEGVMIPGFGSPRDMRSDESWAEHANRMRFDSLRGNKGYPDRTMGQNYETYKLNQALGIPMQWAGPIPEYARREQEQAGQQQAQQQAAAQAQAAQAAQQQAFAQQQAQQQAQAAQAAAQGQQQQQPGLANELPQYMSVFYDNVINKALSRLNEETDQARNSLINRFNMGGLGALGSSALGTALGQVDNERLNRAADLTTNLTLANYEQAKGLRRQTLNDMLQAGGMIQGQNQNVLNAVNPQLMASTPRGKLSDLSAGLASFPQSGQSMQYMPAQPNFLQQLSGAVNTGAGVLGGMGAARGINGPVNPMAHSSLPWSMWY